jgi:hypothetical protein
MSDEIKHENTTGHGSFERQDLQPSGILYFLLTIVVGIVICVVLLKGLFAVLDRREKAEQPPVNPLVTNVQEDTRHIAPGYPRSAFPNPKLEEDERGQLNGILLTEDQTLESYGWIDEKSGTVHIPIDLAMDLLVQRGLPVRGQGAANPADAATPSDKNRKDKKK